MESLVEWCWELTDSCSFWPFVMVNIITCVTGENAFGAALFVKPISELQSITCHMGLHSVTCHPTQVNALYLTHQPERLVLSSPTWEAWTADLILVLVIYWDGLECKKLIVSLLLFRIMYKLLLINVKLTFFEHQCCSVCCRNVTAVVDLSTGQKFQMLHRPIMSFAMSQIIKCMYAYVLFLEVDL